MLRNLSELHEISKVVSSKSNAVRTARQLYEEHIGDYTPIRSLVFFDQIVGTMISHEIMKRPSETVEEVAEAILRSQFEATRGICGEAFVKVMENHNGLKKEYRRRVMKDRRLRLIFYKSPNDVQLAHKLGTIYEAFKQARASSPRSFVDEDWDPYISRFKDCTEELDKLNDQIASILERVEKYKDDKARLWLAVVRQRGEA